MAMEFAPDTPASQLEHMRTAFFAGASHMMSFLEAGAKPTERAPRRMEAIHNELEEFFRYGFTPPRDYTGGE